MTTTTRPADRPTTDQPRPAGSSPPARAPAWRLVATREVLVKLADRNFLIGTLVTLLLIAGLLGLQALLGDRARQPPSRSSTSGPRRSSPGGADRHRDATTR